MAGQDHREDLLSVIEGSKLRPVFQPLVNIQHQRLYGYEALIRGPADSNLHNPLNLFDSALRHGLVGALEYACSQRACERFIECESHGRLFLNVSPSSLHDQHYRLQSLSEILEQVGLAPERVVIELSEQHPSDDYLPIKDAMEHCRAEGFSVAINDLGAGYAGLKTWSDLRPDFVKIDRHFIEHIHADAVKQEFVRSIQELAATLECQVIAEGIESADDLTAVQRLGVPFGQGFCIGRPQSTPEQDFNIVSRIRTPEQNSRSRHRTVMLARELASETLTATAQTTVEEVCRVFHDHRTMSCMPVLDGQTPIGLVDRQDILELLSQQFAHSLHGSKPIAGFMNTAPVVVDANTRLEEVSRQLTTDPGGRLSHDFLITEKGDYFGVGSTSALLKRITDQQMRNARYANPLTLLPGNVPLHERIDALLKDREDFHIAYFDVNHFKPYNDHYGYSCGDDVIIALSQILVEETCPEHDFIGHVGGDDFIAILQSQDWEQRCESILERFRTCQAKFYSAEDFQRGGIWNLDRSGHRQFFELLSLSIGVANPDAEYCQSLHEVSALAVDAKREAKASGGNALFCSRRRRPPDNSADENELARA